MEKELVKKNTSKIVHIKKSEFSITTLCGILVGRGTDYFAFLSKLNPSSSSLCKTCQKIWINNQKELNKNEEQEPKFKKPVPLTPKEKREQARNTVLGFVNPDSKLKPQPSIAILNDIKEKEKELRICGVSDKEKRDQIIENELFGMDLSMLEPELNGKPLNIKIDKTTILTEFIKNSNFFNLCAEIKDKCQNALDEAFESWKKSILSGDKEIPEYEFFYRVQKIREMLDKVR